MTNSCIFSLVKNGIDQVPTPIVTLTTFVHKDLGTQVRIYPQLPPFFSFRTRRLTWDGPVSETVKSEAPCDSRYGTIKIFPCSNAISNGQRVRPKLNNSSLVMVTSLVFQYSPLTLKRKEFKNLKTRRFLLLYPSIFRKNSYYLSI